VSRRARTIALFVTFALLGAALVAGVLLPVPYVRLSPGPVYDALSEVEGEPVVSVTGADTYPTSGSMGITTVYEKGSPGSRLSLFEAMRGWIAGSDDVLPRDLLFPPDAFQGDDAGDQFEQQGRLEMEESEQNAVVAALEYTDQPVTFQVLVDATQPDTPADGVLRHGDVVVQVDGDPITTYRDVKQALGDVVPGDEVTVVVRRKGERRELTMTTIPNPDDEQRAYLGVSLALGFRSPVEVDVALANVGGPSAGLMFSLAIVDTLTPGALTGGASVAGTGTISPRGDVGPIGGIVQKMYGARADGATLFLAPRSNCREVVGNEPEGLTVAAVGTLDDAVGVLEGESAPQPCT
jgi:PDZ domain-containing protein